MGRAYALPTSREICVSAAAIVASAVIAAAAMIVAAAATAMIVLGAVVTAAAANQDNQNDNPQTTAKTIVIPTHRFHLILFDGRVCLCSSRLLKHSMADTCLRFIRM